MISMWRRLPVILQAVLVGGLAAVAGTTPWALLVSLNSKYWSAVPWAVPPTALYLWVYWRFVRGDGWPRSTAETRRTNCRANRLTDEVWGAALIAGILGLVAMLFFQGILGRLVAFPQQQDLDVSQYPPITVFLWVVMSAAVAGVSEEVSFRGYMQGAIERRHGPVVAILVTGTVFGLAHFTHPEVTLTLMPFYLAVAAVYGALAHLTNSIFPGMVLHAGGNVVVALNFFTAGRSEWQGLSASQSLVWETGVDASFWFSIAGFVVVGSGAVWAYTKLAHVARAQTDGSRKVE